jgi:hypothetical protein
MNQRTRWYRRGLLAGVALLAILGLGAAVGLGAEDASKNAAIAESAPQKTDDKVYITLQTVPPRKAVVKWGSKTLGVIPVPRPLVVVRPRDSGPLDLVVRVAGFLPVHTRAYTFSDSRVAIKLTPVSEKNTLFGYRQEVPPQGAASPDAGAPPPAPPPAPTPVPQR